MGRKKRVDNTGHLKCTKCQQFKHISEFYQASLESRGVYFVQDDIEYGYPLAWCKTCSRAIRGKHKETKREAIEQEVTSREAELEHIKAELAKQGLELWIHPQTGEMRAIPIQRV